MPWTAASAKRSDMPKGQTPDRKSDLRPDPSRRDVVAVRVMTAVSVALAVMCVYLAYAWNAERETAACWRTAAEFQFQPDGECRG